MKTHVDPQSITTNKARLAFEKKPIKKQTAPAFYLTGKPVRPSTQAIKISFRPR